MSKTFSNNTYHKPLSSIKKGEIGIIKEIESGELSLRLMEMGCVIGEKVKLMATAPLGDPIAIEIADYNLCLRKYDAQKITIEVNSNTI